jgi:hypothetical protein
MAVPILDFESLEAAVRSLKVPELGPKRTNPVLLKASKHYRITIPAFIRKSYNFLSIK